MQRTPVTSAAIAAIGFDDQTNTLEVHFHTGRVYRYFMVPASVHQALLRSESIGAFFNAEVRDRFRYIELP